MRVELFEIPVYNFNWFFQCSRDKAVWPQWGTRIMLASVTVSWIFKYINTYYAGWVLPTYIYWNRVAPNLYVDIGLWKRLFVSHNYLEIRLDHHVFRWKSNTCVKFYEQKYVMWI